MGTAPAARAAGALAQLLLLLVCSAAALPTRCSSCRAVAEELVARLDAEQPRNHIDMQHRVGPDGKRWGKVIEYKISELRVIHLLEDLCDGMDSYQIAKGAAGEHWARPGSLDASIATVSPRKEQRRQLSNFCHDVIEKHEDELSQALCAGDVSSENASDFLCVKSASLCKQTLAEEQAAAAAARAAAEEAARAAAEKEAAAAAEKDKEAAAAAGKDDKAGQQADGSQESGTEAQQAAGEPEAASAAAAAAGGDAMQEARSEL